MVSFHIFFKNLFLLGIIKVYIFPLFNAQSIIKRHQKIHIIKKHFFYNVIKGFELLT